MKFKRIITLVFLLISFSLIAQEDEALPDIDLETVEGENLSELDSTTSNAPSTNEANLEIETTSATKENQASEATPEAELDLELDLNENKAPPSHQSISKENDELKDLQDDLSDSELSIGLDQTPIDFNTEDITKPKPETPRIEQPSVKAEVVNDSKPVMTPATDVFEVGKEEKELLQLARSFQGQVSSNEWNELATTAKVSSYTVVKDDWLFKISKRLFGSGFYYAKIWALNPYITNPHLIEPGMILSFTTGSEMNAPELKMGEFSENELKAQPGESSPQAEYDLALWGEDSKPAWLDEKQKLIEQNVYVQYATGDTIEDLEKAAASTQIKEYENYEPPQSIQTTVSPEEYDRSGFDRSSKISFKYREGFYLNTFISNNVVQDFGKIEAGPNENVFFSNGDRAFISFDDSVNVVPGDRFSLYAAQGKVKHKNSDREGYKYTITGQAKVIGKIEDRWEVEFSEVTGLIQRGDRITVYTPKIERIITTFSDRIIEASILATHTPSKTLLGYGDVVYLDRGRADGVEMGNVFEVYGFKDRSNNKNITNQPTYKNGELTVITLTDNFSTALVTQSVRDFYVGDIAITKSKSAALKTAQLKKAQKSQSNKSLDKNELDELDVDLNLDSLGDKLLDQADKIQLTDDELAELERQEREKSILKDTEKDLKSLERLEKEIENAEKLLNEAKMDEDKLLEGESLDKIENNRLLKQEDSLDEIEENMGKRYVDEDLNKKDNPYGLSEFDIEEVDELLNVEKDEKPRKAVKPLKATAPEVKPDQSPSMEDELTQLEGVEESPKLEGDQKAQSEMEPMPVEESPSSPAEEVSPPAEESIMAPESTEAAPAEDFPTLPEE